MTHQNEETKLDFNLPFEPYKHQRLFMNDAYECFEGSRFGLFESPTGSGKTIAILAAIIAWLDKNRVKGLMRKMGSDEPQYADPSIPDWVRKSAIAQKEKAAEDLVNEDTRELEELRSRIEKKFDFADGHIRLKGAFKRHRDEIKHEDEQEIMTKRPRLQVIICSRTFSQLNQYVSEFRRLNSKYKLAIVSGRFQVCINERVRRCKTAEELNEECKRTSCAYRKDLRELCESMLAYSLDMEEVVQIGKDMCACPYYAGVQNVAHMDIILLPYVSILNDSVRESLGIDLKGNIIIFDEGHNLSDAIEEAQSVKISLKELQNLSIECKGYFNKFASTISVDEVNGLKLVMDMLSTLETHAMKYNGGSNAHKDGYTSSNGSAGPCLETNFEDSMAISSFIVEFGLQDVKFHTIVDFLASTDFTRKFRGYVERIKHAAETSVGSNMEKSADIQTVSTFTIYTLKSFIQVLLKSNSNDRAIITRNRHGLEIEIFSLSADKNFHEIVSEAHSVLVMSGTLSPIEGFLRLVPPNMNAFIHNSPPVFPLNRFFASIIDRDKMGRELRFDYVSRAREMELTYLCELLDSISSIVPNGIVCFFSSYKFLNQFRTFLENSRFRVSIMSKKRLFFEKQGHGSVFDDYSRDALERGAILFGVFGGSQSEGVNFSDGLARLVLLVGLPYPPDSIKLALKRQNAEKLSGVAHLDRTLLCFKSVNQCIGRAMRHRMDFAAIILLDSRYGGKDSKYLSTYVQESLRQRGTGSNLEGALEEFYATFRED